MLSVIYLSFMILTDIIKIHQDFIILWLGLDMHDFATYILKCIDTCIWWLFNFVCVGQSSHSVYIFSVSCFFFIIIWFPVLCPYSTHSSCLSNWHMFSENHHQSIDNHHILCIFFLFHASSSENLFWCLFQAEMCYAFVSYFPRIRGFDQCIQMGDIDINC